MDGETLVERVREAKATELDRLGSEKALIATTEAQLDAGTVLERTAAAERRAAATFAAWADDEDSEAARDAFERVAEQERSHADLVGEFLDDDVEPGTDALHEYLRGLEGTVERVAAGLVGRPLVSSRTLLQVVNFFVNEAGRAEAEAARELRADTDALVEEGATLLDEVCGEGDWERAEAAATETIEVAYGEYADTLEGMGVDPRPVC